MYEPSQDDFSLWTAARDWIFTESQQQKQQQPMEPPLIKSQLKTLKYQSNFKGQGMLAYVNARAKLNAGVILLLYQKFCQFLLEQLGLDLVCQSNASISRLAFEAIWLRYAQETGPLGHAIEKISPYLESLIRPHCKGGFSYSCQDHVTRGYPLATGMENASSIWEYDLCSAYGHSGAVMTCPSGFGVVCGGGMPTRNRYNSFEYKAVMYTIYKLRYMDNKSIATVYSNFSHYGLVTIGRYPLDLVVVFEDGDIDMFNMDGHFCHGDYARPDSCPSLLRYANNLTRQECEQRTKFRDESIRRWISKVFDNGAADRIITYTVVTDCCHPEYSKSSLDRYFREMPDLRDLVQGMDHLPGLNIELANHTDTSFLAVADVEFNVTHATATTSTSTFASATANIHGNDKPHSSFGPIFDYDEISGMQTTTWHKQQMLLTSDYYAYLRCLCDQGPINTHYRYQLTVGNVEWVVYYKSNPCINHVFDWLLAKRFACAEKKTVTALFKAIINYGCGYFGLNIDKSMGKTKARIVTKLPKTFNLMTHNVEPLGCFGQFDLLLVRHATLRKSIPTCPTPLPIFVNIVEHGKLKMSRILYTLQLLLRPTSYRLLYSNVDNIIIALAADTWEGCLRAPFTKATFYQYWNRVAMVDNDANNNNNNMPSPSKPGYLKLEWNVTSSSRWKFVSPFCMYYAMVVAAALASDNDVTDNNTNTGTGSRHSVYKTSSFNNLDATAAYNMAMAILKRQSVTVSQTRRTDKLANSNTHVLEVTMRQSRVNHNKE